MVNVFFKWCLFQLLETYRTEFVWLNPIDWPYDLRNISLKQYRTYFQASLTVAGQINSYPYFFLPEWLPNQTLTTTWTEVSFLSVSFRANISTPAATSGPISGSRLPGTPPCTTRSCWTGSRPRERRSTWRSPHTLRWFHT